MPVSNPYDSRTEEEKRKYKKWEAYLPHKINCYSWYFLDQLKVRAVNAGEWSSQIASKVFEQGELRIFMDLYRLRNFPLRNEGRIFQDAETRYIWWVLFGLLLGETERSTLLARMALQAYRENLFVVKGGSVTAGNLMWRMLGEHLGESVPELPNCLYPERKEFFDTTPYMDEMFAHWKDPDPQVMAPCLKNLCDCHTQHGFKGKQKSVDLREFSMGRVERIPLAALMVMKLRQMRGLENPVIEHPLMDTALGHLPKDAHFVPDDVLTRVRARMRDDGFDEQAILKMYGVEGPLPAYWQH